MDVKTKTGELRDRARYLLSAVIVTALCVGPAIAANATAGDGTANGVTYGLGELGAPGASDYQMAGQGLVSSVAPILVALLPVAAIFMAIMMGPKILKKIAARFSGG